MTDLSFIGPTPEELKYWEEWRNYQEKFHDYNTEEKIDTMKINIYFPKKFSEICKDDFEISYITKDTFDDMFENTYLRKLFEQGFEYFYLNKSSNLYKACAELKNHIIYSIFMLSGKNVIRIFKKDTKLYYARSKSYYKKIKKVYIGYLGEIGNSTKVQTTIFDYIED